LLTPAEPHPAELEKLSAEKPVHCPKGQAPKARKAQRPLLPPLPPPLEPPPPAQESAGGPAVAKCINHQKAEKKTTPNPAEERKPEHPAEETPKEHAEETPGETPLDAVDGFEATCLCPKLN